MDQQCDCQTAVIDEQKAYQTLLQVIEDYDRKPSNLIQILHMAQAIFGYLPETVQRFICEQMELPFSEVSGVVSFIRTSRPSPKAGTRSRSAWEQRVMSGEARRCWMP